MNSKIKKRSTNFAEPSLLCRENLVIVHIFISRAVCLEKFRLDQTKQALTRSQASRESFNRYTKVDDSGCDDLESLRREAELERLEAIKTELREDRTQLTEASLKLDKERAQIEVRTPGGGSIISTSRH